MMSIYSPRAAICYDVYILTTCCHLSIYSPRAAICSAPLYYMMSVLTTCCHLLRTAHYSVPLIVLASPYQTSSTLTSTALLLRRLLVGRTVVREARYHHVLNLVEEAGESGGGGRVGRRGRGGEDGEERAGRRRRGGRMRG
jgi:hypothetical protein